MAIDFVPIANRKQKKAQNHDNFKKLFFWFSFPAKF